MKPLTMEEINNMREKRSPILMWRFEDAPTEYQARSPHGGDEDWVVYVPSHYLDEWMPWLEEGLGSIGVCSISKHETEGGMVFIGAHS